MTEDPERKYREILNMTRDELDQLCGDVAPDVVGRPVGHQLRHLREEFLGLPPKTAGPLEIAFGITLKLLKFAIPAAIVFFVYRSCTG